MWVHTMLDIEKAVLISNNHKEVSISIVEKANFVRILLTQCSQIEHVLSYIPSRVCVETIRIRDLITVGYVN